jgi:hypothetical protein
MNGPTGDRLMPFDKGGTILTLLKSLICSSGFVFLETAGLRDGTHGVALHGAMWR